MQMAVPAIPKSAYVPSCARGFAVIVAFALFMSGAASLPSKQLRVCADPNNLPFSNSDGEGFENKIAALMAERLHLQLTYYWWPQRRGFIRNTLNAGNCDLIIGTPSGVEGIRTTRPYYRSAFTFVTRADLTPLNSLDDERLRTLKVGVQLAGDDGSNPPPAQALAKRGIVQNVRGYLVYGDYRERQPAAAIMRALLDREVDVAIVWGPLAGYWQRYSETPLRVSTVLPLIDEARLPMAFDISMGVRKDDVALRDNLNALLVDEAAGIKAILAEYGVVTLDQRSPATRRPTP
jgi:mxaJ protein